MCALSSNASVSLRQAVRSKIAQRRISLDNHMTCLRAGGCVTRCLWRSIMGAYSWNSRLFSTPRRSICFGPLQREIARQLPDQRNDPANIRGNGAGFLGSVDKFEPVSGGGDVYHAHEGFGELVVSRGDGPVDFETPKHALDLIALLVEGTVMFDLHPAV